jgi:hypothetical protein
MRKLMTSLAALAVAPALLSAMPCDPPRLELNWDFSVGTNGFTTQQCDSTAAATWSPGIDPLFEGFYLWGTDPGDFYPANADDSLLSPEFAVTPTAYLVEIFHWYDIAQGDGGNITVGDEVVVPLEGYPVDDLAVGCLAGQPGFRGQAGWGLSCLDLSAFMGQTVQLSFNFASDASGDARGWYLSFVRVGGDPAVATTPTTWSTLKALHR